MKRRTAFSITTTLTLGVLLSTSIGVIPTKAEEPVKNNILIASPKQR